MPRFLLHLADRRRRVVGRPEICYEIRPRSEGSRDWELVNWSRR